MHVTYNAAENREEIGVALDRRSPEPIFTIRHREVADKSYSGDHLDVCRIDIESEDGEKIGRFWVDINLDNQGRPTLRIATNVGDKTNVKTLRGSWR